MKADETPARYSGGAGGVWSRRTAGYGEPALDYRPEVEEPRWRRLADSAFRYRWMIAGIIVACTLAGALVAYLTPPHYIATASIILDRPQRRLAQVTPTADYVSYDADRATQTQLTILTSHAVARQTIRQLHLEQRDVRIRRALEKIDAALAKKHERLAPGPRMQIATAIFLGELQAKPQKLSSTVEVQFGGRDPRLAAAVANQVVSNYIAYRLRSHAAVGRRLDGWLGQRLAGVRARLLRDNAALQAMQQQSGFIPLPAQNGAQNVNIERLDLINHELAEAQAAAILAQAMQAAYSGDVATVPATLRTPATDAAVQNLQRARQQYDALAAAYQPRFAPVEVARDQMQRAQARVRALSAELAASLAQGVRAAEQRVAALTAALGQARRQAANRSGVALQYG
ncbi:MAG: GumC family protein, partial [Terriglobales bacterium]